MKKINRIRNRKKVVVLLMALSLFTSYCLSTTTVSATPKQLQNELVESTKTVPLNDEPLESRVGGITYSYGTGPLYGKSSDYTVYKNTVSNPNLPLTKEIGSYSLTALGILLGKESTPAGIAATCVQTVYDKFYGTKTKGLSYKTKIYTHKSYSTGNTPSGDIVKNRLLHGIHKRIIQELQLQLYNLRTGIYINEKFKIYFYSVNNIKCYSNYFR